MKVRGHKHVVILLVYTRLGYSSTPKQELFDISHSKTFVYSTLVRLRDEINSPYSCYEINTAQPLISHKLYPYCNFWKIKK